MAELWPRNIVPIGDKVVKMLSTGRALALYLTALDEGVAEKDLVRVTGLPRAEAEEMAREMIGAGLLRLEEGRYLAGTNHLREEDMDAPDRASFRLTLLQVAQGALDETRHAVRSHQEGVRAGVGFVTLPDDAETLARATAIIAEAEDQLRALQEERPPSTTRRRLRVMLFLGSTSGPTSGT